jgi:5-formyltetrahydrofolate cyclo-ligase
MTSDGLPALRRRLRRARRALGAARLRANSESIVSRLHALREARVARRIAWYIAADGEPDLSGLRAGPLASARNWYLPVLRGHAKGRLWFVRQRPGEPMRPNRYGIPEPACRRNRLQPVHGLDLILMPLVGFDVRCNRLGMGAGFYDRSLAPLRHRRHWRRPLLIGVAHECQRVEHIDARPWDVPLDAVVTEAAVYRRPKSTD